MDTKQEPKARHPVFLFLFTSRALLISVACLWTAAWIVMSVQKSDWQWFSRSGAVTGIIGAVLSCRSVLRLTRAERIRRQKMTIIECFTQFELDDQERDSSAVVLGVLLMLFGTLVWAYGDLIPEIMDFTK
jgi:uncharacterized membrane protein YcjF (UPF0283 family)